MQQTTQLRIAAQLRLRFLQEPNQYAITEIDRAGLTWY